MKKNIIFLAGIYGVGKSTICKHINQYLRIPTYSASDLIANQNQEVYGKNKYVINSDNNQNILINEVNKVTDNIFILDGHFCLKAKDNKVIILKEEIFKQLNLNSILLLTAKSEEIQKNLNARDNVIYDIDYINKLLECEEKQAKKVSNSCNVPLYIYDMKYNDEDINIIESFIIKILKEEGK